MDEQFEAIKRAAETEADAILESIWRGVCDETIPAEWYYSARQELVSELIEVYA